MRLINDTNRLRLLVFRFLEQQGEDYCRLYRFSPERITGDLRDYFTHVGVYTLYSNEVLYSYIEARLRYVFDLAAEYKQTKRRLGLTEEDLSKFFGYADRPSFAISNKKNQHITAFLSIARAIMP